MERKTKQLGMNPGTASNRLLKDLLFEFVVQAGHKCHRCGEELIRESFSIEHITPWLDSKNPVELFFALDNIAYSHLKCNVGARRRYPVPIRHGTRNGYSKGCRCKDCTSEMSRQKADWRKRSGKH